MNHWYVVSGGAVAHYWIAAAVFPWYQATLCGEPLQETYSNLKRPSADTPRCQACQRKRVKNPVVWAVFKDVKHLFVKADWDATRFVPVCSRYAAIGAHLLHSTTSPHNECAVCETYAWRETIRIDGWYSTCGIGDPHFPDGPAATGTDPVPEAPCYSVVWDDDVARFQCSDCGKGWSIEGDTPRRAYYCPFCGIHLNPPPYERCV